MFSKNKNTKYTWCLHFCFNKVILCLCNIGTERDISIDIGMKIKIRLFYNLKNNVCSQYSYCLTHVCIKIHRYIIQINSSTHHSNQISELLPSE